MKQKQKKRRIMFPIGVKLIVIISILLLVSLGAVIMMVSVLSTQEVQKTAETNNFTVNQRAASQADGSFKSIQSAVLLYLEMTDLVPSELILNHELEKYFFSHNIAAIGVKSDTKSDFFINQRFFNTKNIEIEEVENYLAVDLPATENQIRFFNASGVFQFSLINAVFIRQGLEGNETVKVLFVPDDLSESFGAGTNTSFLINSSGDLLLHADNNLVLGGANFSALPIVAIMQQQGDINRQISYNDGGTEYFGAYYRIAGTDTAVITTIPHSLVFEAIQSITRQNMFLTAAVLFIAIILVWLFSKTISSPVRSLASAVLKIEEGEFSVYLEPQTRDELGVLTESFDNMSRALNIFGRFTNKDIAIRAMRGEIKPGGQPKHATIFFSDIRGFTEKSENFGMIFGDEASNRIVLWLNEYFTQMIHCVEVTGGVVDKFVGDAMMAHWGAAFTAGTPQKDAYNCVKAALLMREALIKLNTSRSEKTLKENPVIHIGCGINTGVVTAGQIGSEERMEYTVIGTPVNLASRIEALNKAFGTDILIAEDTWRLIGDEFIIEEMMPALVKGKEKPMRVFAVVNFKDSSSGPQTLSQVRELLGIKAPDLSKINIDDKEDKFKVQSSAAVISKKTETNTADGPVITMTSFGPSSWVKGFSGKLVPVFFSWKISDSKDDTHVIIEVAKDRDFDSIVEERDVFGSFSATIPLKDGLYWWRVYPVREGSREPANQIYPCGALVVDIDEKDKVKIKQG